MWGDCADGGLWSWGYGEDGKLAHGDEATSHEPRHKTPNQSQLAPPRSACVHRSLLPSSSNLIADLTPSCREILSSCVKGHRIAAVAMGQNHSLILAGRSSH